MSNVMQDGLEKAGRAILLRDFYIYLAIKYSITVPVIFIFNVVDLCILGVPKKLIKLPPLHKSLPCLFFKRHFASLDGGYTLLEDDEKGLNTFSGLTNHGFAGLARQIVSTLIELPVSIISIALAVSAYLIQTLISTFLLKPIVAICSCTLNNSARG